MAIFDQYIDLFRKRYKIRPVTMEDEQEFKCDISNHDAISNELQ